MTFKLFVLFLLLGFVFFSSSWCLYVDCNPNVIQIAAIYGSLGYPDDVFPNGTVAAIESSVDALFPSSYNYPGQGLLLQVTVNAMELWKIKINEAGGIPLHDEQDTRYLVEITYFNVNYYDYPASEIRLVSQLTNATGPYGHFLYIVNVFGVNSDWALACQNSGTCIVGTGTPPVPSDFICTLDPVLNVLPADCVANGLLAGERRFTSLYSAFPDFTEDHSAEFSLLYQNGVTKWGLICTPLPSDQQECAYTEGLGSDLNMELVFQLLINVTAPNAWSMDEAVQVVQSMQQSGLEALIFVAVSDSGLPTWLQQYMQILYEAMESINYAPAYFGVDSSPVATLPPVLTQFTDVKYPWISSVRGESFRCINSSSNLEIYPAQLFVGGLDSPAVFVQDYQDYYGGTPLFSGYQSPAAAYNQVVTILQKMIEVSRSIEPSKFVLTGYTISVPSVFGLLQFDGFGRALLDDRNLVFEQYLLAADGVTQLEYVVSPPTIAKPLIYPMPNWSERTFDPSIRYRTIEVVVMALSGFLILLSCISKILVFRYRHTEILKASSPVFLLFLLLGADMLLLFNFFNNLTQNIHTCQAQVWLITLGFTLMYGSIFLRVLRIVYIFNSSKLANRVAFTDLKLAGLLFAAIAFDVVYNGIWTRYGMNISYVVNIPYFPYYDYYQCVADNVGQGFALGSLAYKCLWILFGVILTFRAHDVPDKFNETGPLFISIYCTVVVCVVFVPLVATQACGRTVTYIIQDFGMLGLVISVLCLILLPKLYYTLSNDFSVSGSGSRVPVIHSIPLASSDHNNTTAGASTAAIKTKKIVPNNSNKATTTTSVPGTVTPV